MQPNLHTLGIDLLAIVAALVGIVAVTLVFFAHDVIASYTCPPNAPRLIDFCNAILRKRAACCRPLSTDLDWVRLAVVPLGALLGGAYWIPCGLVLVCLGAALEIKIRRIAAWWPRGSNTRTLTGALNTAPLLPITRVLPRSSDIEPRPVFLYIGRLIHIPLAERVCQREQPSHCPAWGHVS